MPQELGGFFILSAYNLDHEYLNKRKPCIIKQACWDGVNRLRLRKCNTSE